MRRTYSDTANDFRDESHDQSNALLALPLPYRSHGVITPTEPGQGLAVSRVHVLTHVLTHARTSHGMPACAGSLYSGPV
jgi:hypothetical protein